MSISVILLLHSFFSWQHISGAYWYFCYSKILKKCYQIMKYNCYLYSHETIIKINANCDELLPYIYYLKTLLSSYHGYVILKLCSVVTMDMWCKNSDQSLSYICYLKTPISRYHEYAILKLWQIVAMVRYSKILISRYHGYIIWKLW